MKILEGRHLSAYTTFRIGGPARFLAEASSVEEMVTLLAWAKERGVPTLIIGRGSNSLFPDEGFAGLVIVNRLDFTEIDGTTVKVGAGANFANLGVRTARIGLSGLEFASGIPASCGGAIYMNAGANGQQTCTCLTQVQWLDSDGKLHEELPEGFAYRFSPFQTNQAVILGATFTLTTDEMARRRQIDIVKKRQQTQPLADASCGCIFRNPEGDLSAGAMIEQSGLKGHTKGGAQVSPIHANFIINRGNATASDVNELILVIKERVAVRFHVDLEEEIRRH